MYGKSLNPRLDIGMLMDVNNAACVDAITPNGKSITNPINSRMKTKRFSKNDPIFKRNRS